MTFDSYLFWIINQFAGRQPVLDTVAIFFAKYLGYLLILFLLILLLRNFRKYWLIVAQSLTAAILSRMVITNIIRWILERPRPFMEDHVNLLLQHEPTGSFPSGHASFYFAIAAVVYFYNKKAGLLFFGASFLISISRVFAGVHWPSDILGGALIGIFSGWITVLFSQKLFPTAKTKSQQ